MTITYAVSPAVKRLRKGNDMAELLVSVRSPQEAQAALVAGTSVIDVKEPLRGSLGRADDATIAAILRETAGRRPVSVAMGELVERLPRFEAAGLSYLKWGLAGCGGRPRWRAELAEAIASLHKANARCRAVATAYADWRRADAPLPEEVCAFACTHSCGAFLLDTWHKDGTTLLEWLAPAEVGRLCQTCRKAGVRVALAGSLGPAQIRVLRALGPDWFAVRGAVCGGGRREQAIDSAAVARLVDLVGSHCGPMTEIDTPYH
jgi:uncharacterized protein (UPF0264 family)